MNDIDEDEVYERLEALNRDGRLRPAGSDGGGGERGAHLAALVASEFCVPDDQMVVAALAAIEQLAAWQGSEGLDLGSGEDLADFREMLAEIERIAMLALGVLDRRIAVLADGVSDE